MALRIVLLCTLHHKIMISATCGLAHCFAPTTTDSMHMAPFERNSCIRRNINNANVDSCQTGLLSQCTCNKHEKPGNIYMYLERYMHINGKMCTNKYISDFNPSHIFWKCNNPRIRFRYVVPCYKAVTEHQKAWTIYDSGDQQCIQLSNGESPIIYTFRPS